MAYEDDFERFRNAFAEATAASIVMPYAAGIATMLGMMISDPASMKKASQDWLSVATPDYSSECPSSSSIKLLREQLRGMATQAGKDKVWTGEAYEAFLGKVDLLDKSLDKLDRGGKAAGDTLNTSAEVTHFASKVAEAIGFILAALAAFLLASMVYPPMYVQAQISVFRIVTGLYQGMQKVMGNHTKFVWKAAALVGIAGAVFGQFSRALPMMSAVNASPPKLIEAKAAWNPSEVSITGDMTPKMDVDTSFMPEVGV
ncbi:hypothetical protein [Nonomuraea endophytica]|uniref:hypothetical protein n=1 Tax=Nonomuraea endophytica TaxID=714136 RepID=UPI0037C95F82